MAAAQSADRIRHSLPWYILCELRGRGGRWGGGYGLRPFIQCRKSLSYPIRSIALPDVRCAWVIGDKTMSRRSRRLLILVTILVILGLLLSGLSPQFARILGVLGNFVAPILLIVA